MSEIKQKIVNLQYPIPNGDGGQTSKLKLKRLKLKHLKLLPKDFANEESNIDLSTLIILLSGMAELPIEAIEEIDSIDLENISKEINDFLLQSL
jgi:predicted transcriptional regulator